MVMTSGKIGDLFNQSVFWFINLILAMTFFADMKLTLHKSQAMITGADLPLHKFF